MNRRAFLQILASAPAAYVIDPEKLLWVPRHDRIFVPHPRQVAMMGTTLQTIIEVEMKYVIPRLQVLFEKDDIFYDYLKLAKVIKNVGPQTSLPIRRKG